MLRTTIRTKHEIVAGVEAELLKRVRLKNGLSRVELARELHLAPSTAGIYVDRLKHEGFLTESKRVDRKYGRRPTLLTPNSSAGRFVGVDFEAHSIMTTVVDFSLHVLSRSQRAIPPGDSVEKILKRMEASIGSVIKGGTTPLLGIGVGVPGVIDIEKGTASQYEFIPGWHQVPVGERLAGKFGVPVHLENNIRSMAMAELWLGQGMGLRDFVCLGVRTGIGVAVVINGELYRGGHGCAGEIGVWPAAGVGNHSEAEGRHTLEHEASLSAILAAAEKATGRKMDPAELRTALEIGDRGVRNVLRQAAAVHGAAIGQLHALLDAERIIIVGPLAELGPAFLLPFSEAVGSHFDGGPPLIVNSSFGQFGGALGAAALAAHHWRPIR